MMISMQEASIEGPLKRLPGQKEDAPYYVQYTNRGMPPQSGAPDDNDSVLRSSSLVRDPAPTSGTVDHTQLRHKRSILRQPSSAASGSRRPRGESLSAMAKRVDFSLGMKDVSSGGLMGDLYENVSPNRMPGIRLDSASRSRDARDRIAEEDEEQLNAERDGRSTSRAVEGSSRYGLHRSSTGSDSRIKRSFSSIHRNRFFPRHARRNSKGEYEDLMEQGMADIPESTGAHGLIDPRSGHVSPQAVRMTTESDLARGALPGASVHHAGFEGPSRSQTENYEMRDMN